MYHYYVRYSVYNNEGKRIGQGWTEFSVKRPILYSEDIKMIADRIKDETKKSEMPDAAVVIIDFYNFLRQE